MKYLTVCASAAAVISCNAGYEFLGEDPNDSSSSPPKAEILEGGNQGSDDATADLDGIIVERNFTSGRQEYPVEMIFVVDNSISMAPLLANVESGLLAALSDNKFPPGARIGGISTMIADANDFSTVHSSITSYTGINLEPGFLSLIDQASVSNYRNQVPGFADRWALDACSDALFQANALNGNGEPCLRAILQSSSTALGTEAGVHAVYQFLSKNFDQLLFRDNALVNFIFISDTHDPGRPDQDLIDSRPSLQDIALLANFDTNIKGLKFHAIAPEQQCTSEDVFDRAYYKIANESGGTITDSCTTTDFSEFISTMIADAQVIESTFALQPPALSVDQILVNGEVHIDYSVSNQGRQLTLVGLDNELSYDVQITYTARQE